MKKNYNLYGIKGIVKYMICAVSVMMACYGFWGCLFPDLTLVEGTYRIVREAASEEVTDGKALKNQTTSEEATDSKAVQGKKTTAGAEGSKEAQGKKTTAGAEGSKEAQDKRASDETADSKSTYDKDAEALYADILGGKVKVTYRSKILELFKYKRGLKND